MATCKYFCHSFIITSIFGFYLVLKFAQRDKLDIHDFTQGVKITGVAPKKSKDEKYIHSKADYIKLLNYLKKSLVTKTVLHHTSFTFN